MEKCEYEIMYKMENSYWWYCGLHELVESSIHKYFPNAQKLSIFDAGCGTGRMIERLACFGNVFGIDSSEEALNYCRNRRIKNVNQGDLNFWIGIPNTYDVIYSLDVLCHAAINDEKNILSNFHSALKPDGILILNLPAFNSLYRNHDKAVHTKNRYTTKSIRSLLTSIGYKIEFATYRLFPFFFVLFAKKIIDNFQKSFPPVSDLQSIPPLLNRMLLAYNRFENNLITAKIPISLGSSVFVIARKYN